MERLVDLGLVRSIGLFIWARLRMFDDTNYHDRALEF